MAPRIAAEYDYKVFKESQQYNASMRPLRIAAEYIAIYSECEAVDCFDQYATHTGRRPCRDGEFPITIFVFHL